MQNKKSGTSGKLDNPDLSKSAAVLVGSFEGGDLAALLVLSHHDRLRGQRREDRAVVVRVLHQDQHLGQARSKDADYCADLNNHRLADEVVPAQVAICQCE